jgi:tetraacyldisaccharide 4'-kinase
MRNELLWERGRGPGPLVRALSDSWGLVNRLRRWSYRKGILPSEKAPIPVISVGNLTVGGNSKTPMCAFLAKALADRGHVPAILSRGYGRKRSRMRPDPVVVSLGLGPLVPLEFSGDEPALLARLTPAMVLVSARRAPAAREAAGQGAGVAILDDGFQHLRLRRDCNILMVRAADGLGNGRVVPAGPLREPASARADADIVVTVGLGDVPPHLGRLFAPKPVFGARVEAGRLSSPDGRVRLAVQELAGKRLAAFCGLARPKAFKETLTGLGLPPVAFRAFPDHEPYGPIERRALEELLLFSRSEFLLTTQKDAVKLRDLRLPILALEARLAPSDPEGLMGAILGMLPGLKAAPAGTQG